METKLKKYSVNCHYDMVITVDVFAASEDDALHQAYNKAADMPLDDAECYGHSECVADIESVSQKEEKRLVHDTIIKFVHQYVDDIATDMKRKQEFADMVFNRHKMSIVPWANGLGYEYPEWQRKIFLEAADWITDFAGLCNRYARMYASKVFYRRYKNVAKTLFAADVDGCDKLQKKQAVMDGLQVLCDKMEEYVCHQDDEDYKGWEPQMIIRYKSETGDEENYWNLFVYCTGPNDKEGDDYLSVSTAWQHVWLDDKGRDATDDYGTELHDTKSALLRHLFYDDPEAFEETDEQPIWERITDVWVD